MSRIDEVYGKIPSNMPDRSPITSVLCSGATCVREKTCFPARETYLKVEGVGIMKRAAIYLRVSTVDQHTSNQEQELRQVAERAGWEVVEVYRDHGISGAKGRNKRACAGGVLWLATTSNTLPSQR